MHSQDNAVSSALMVGHVRHRRLSPVAHDLTYPLFMPAIDLDQWSELQQNVWGWVRNGGIGHVFVVKIILVKVI